MTDWSPSLRYPDPAVTSLDKRFDKYRLPLAGVERLFTGARWSEGPVWFGDGRYLLWSDVPGNCIRRWDEETGAVSYFRNPSNNGNGNTRDRQGRLVTCEHLTRRVTRTEYDGTVTVICDKFEGKRLNSPNDVVVKSDDSIWFTDPTYGIDTDYEGDRAESEIGRSNVYRVDPKSGAVTVVVSDMIKPNGLAFSLDESQLYVVDTGRSHVPDGPAHIRRFAVGESGALVDKGLFADCTAGFFDGLRLDTQGRIWTSAGDGVHCFDPDGTLIGKIAIPELVANVTFGGAKRNRLFICGTTSIYAAYTTATGVSLP